MRETKENTSRLLLSLFDKSLNEIEVVEVNIKNAVQFQRIESFRSQKKAQFGSSSPASRLRRGYSSQSKLKISVILTKTNRKTNRGLDWNKFFPFWIRNYSELPSVEMTGRSVIIIKVQSVHLCFSFERRKQSITELSATKVTVRMRQWFTGLDDAMVYFTPFSTYISFCRTSNHCHHYHLMRTRWMESDKSKSLFMQTRDMILICLQTKWQRISSSKIHINFSARSPMRSMSFVPRSAETNYTSTQKSGDGKKSNVKYLNFDV